MAVTIWTWRETVGRGDGTKKGVAYAGERMETVTENKRQVIEEGRE